MALRDKYSQAVKTAKQLGMEGSAEERDGKLHFHGTVNSEDEKNQIWNALKTMPDWQKDVVADIASSQALSSSRRGDPLDSSADSAKASIETYTVQSGDTLSAIAKRTRQRERLHGDLQRQPRSAQRPGQDPAGQVLKIPA